MGENMKLLIDANIVLDVLQKREPHYRASACIWKLCEIERAEGWVSALSLANLVYVMRRELTPERTAEVVKRLGLIFRFGDLCGADMLRAAALQWSDFEDALQEVLAERLRADCIITRNGQDFRKGKLAVYSPTEFLAEYGLS